MAVREIIAPMTTLGLDPDQKLAIRGLSGVTCKSVDSVRDYIPMLYTAENFPEKSMTKKVYSGLPIAGAWDGQSVITPVGLEYLYDVTAEHLWYANATSYTYDGQTFDIYDLLRPNAAKQLGLSMAWKKQVLGAYLFNQGFTTAGADGVYFFSASHPSDSRSAITTQSNLVSGALNVTTLNEAKNLLINLRDPLGRPRNMMPKYLYVYPTQVDYAKAVLAKGMGNEYNTADKKRNLFEDYSIEVVPYPWFSTATMWMLQGTQSFCKYSVKIAPTSRMKEQDDWSVKHDVAFCMAFWAESWEGFVGSLGV